MTGGAGPVPPPATWPLVGRDAEVALLDRALSSRRGVVLAGAPGVGKTRLLRETHDLAGRYGFHAERVVASASASSVPLGAFARLHPVPDETTPWTGSLAALRAELRARAGDAPLLVLVDDAHVLDLASAALVHQLAAAADATVIASLRSREPAPDAVVALWKDDLCDRVEVQPLSRAEVGELLTRVLGGPVAATSIHALAEVSRGNVMFLRELVTSGLERGALTVRDGLWTWDRAAVAVPRLVELLTDRLGHLAAPERDGLELVALGEPLRWDVLMQLVAPEVVEALVGKGLLEADERRGEVLVRLAHPLFGEIVTSTLAAPGRREALRRLAHAHGEPTDEDLLRVVTFRLGAGERVPPETLVAAARTCLHVDVARCERLATEALALDGGLAAVELLAHVYQFTHRPAETEELIAGIDPSALVAEERTVLVLLRADNLTWGLGRPDDAVALLDDAAEAATTAGEARSLRAHTPALLLFGGRLREAIERGEAVVADPGATPADKLHAYLGSLPALAATGRPETALARVDAALELVPLCTDELPVAMGQLASGVTLAQQWVGQLDAAQSLMQAAFDEGVARDVPLMRGGSALRLGQIALWRGDARAAQHHLRESIAALRAFDAGFLAWAAHTLRFACALLGDLAGSADAQRIADGALWFPLFTSERFRADAAVAAARGLLSEARAIVADGVEWSLAHEHLVPVVILSWDRARYGDPVAASSTLDALGHAVEGALARHVHAAVRALADGEAPALDAASAAFAHDGYLLHAAECARAAARLHAQRGLRAREAASDERADRLARRCEGVTTPLLARRGTEAALTRREREVAVLATRGLADAAIATRLGISVRTVESHLHRAYLKLGVTSRRELAAVLGVEPSVDDSSAARSGSGSPHSLKPSGAA